MHAWAQSYFGRALAVLPPMVPQAALPSAPPCWQICHDFNRHRQHRVRRQARKDIPGSLPAREMFINLTSKWPNHDIFPLMCISCMRNLFCMSKGCRTEPRDHLMKMKYFSDLVFIFQIFALASLLNNSNAKFPFTEPLSAGFRCQAKTKKTIYRVLLSPAPNNILPKTWKF